jgi:hypothetical protein
MVNARNYIQLKITLNVFLCRNVIFYTTLITGTQTLDSVDCLTLTGARHYTSNKNSMQ